MNYRQMEVFHAIMMTGTVTAAARSLNLTQPAVTKTLLHAESQLKFPLFHRVKGRLVPSDNAISILPEVEQVFREMRSLHQTLDDVREARVGGLSIVAIPTLAQVAIPRAIAAFSAERPNVRISFEVRTKRSVMQTVATQRAEIGFAYLTPTHANVRSSSLCHCNLVCIAPKDHPLAEKEVVTITDIQDYPFIRYSKEQGLQALIDAAMFSKGAQINSQIETGWVSTAWALVNNGMGIALVDDFSHMENLFPSVVTIPFLPETRVQADILTPKSKALSQIAKEFVEVARNMLSAGIKQADT